jgi:hypothetical protein
MAKEWRRRAAPPSAIAMADVMSVYSLRYRAPEGARLRLRVSVRQRAASTEREKGHEKVGGEESGPSGRNMLRTSGRSTRWSYTSILKSST